MSPNNGFFSYQRPFFYLSFRKKIFWKNLQQSQFSKRDCSRITFSPRSQKPEVPNHKKTLKNSYSLNNFQVERTLLHRTLEEGDQTGAVFLITNRAEIDESPRGEGVKFYAQKSFEKQDDLDGPPPSLDDILGGDDNDSEQNPFGDSDQSEDEKNPFDDSEDDDNPFADSPKPKKKSEPVKGKTPPKSPTKTRKTPEHQMPLHTVATHG